MKRLIYLFIVTMALGGCHRDTPSRIQQVKADSTPILTDKREDSLNWYGYQVFHKRKSGDTDSAIHYLKEAIRLRLTQSSRAYGQLGEIYQGKQMNDSAIHYYFLALQKDTTRSAYWYCGSTPAGPGPRRAPPLPAEAPQTTKSRARPGPRPR